MICTAKVWNACTGIQACLNVSLLQRTRCSDSFPAFGQGSSRKAFYVRYLL